MIPTHLFLSFFKCKCECVWLERAGDTCWYCGEKYDSRGRLSDGKFVPADDQLLS